MLCQILEAYLFLRFFIKNQNLEDLAKHVVTTLYQKCCSPKNISDTEQLSAGRVIDKVVNACLIIDRVTRPFLPRGVSNGEGI